MAVVLICPSCQHAQPVHLAPAPSACERCGHAFPEEALAATENSLAESALPRPFGVTLGAGFAAIWGGGVVLFILGSLLGSGPFRINGAVVSKRTFLTSPVVAFFACAAAYALVTAFCVFKRRYPARRLMILPWIVAIGSYFVVPLPDEASRFMGAGIGLLWLLGVLWYLYRKPNVNAYFNRLEAEASSRPRS